jgi:multicomponent Na+:H+ antiporter subunit G
VDVREIAEAALILGGAALILLAAIGIARMPDLLIRMHATTKAATLGSALMVAGVAVHFGSVQVITRAIVIVFLLITAPVAAHMLARASYFLGVPLWRYTMVDELGGHYDRETHQLSAAEEEEIAAIEASMVDNRNL